MVPDCCNARQGRFDRLGVNMAALKGDVITQGLGCWVNGKHGGVVYGHSEKDGVFIDQVLQCPGQPHWLPG